jgi:hypothetical protein
MIPPNVIEVLSVFIQSEDIMITFNKALFAIQTRCSFKCPTIDYIITENINLIIDTHSLIPKFNQCFIHFFWIVPGTKFSSFIREELAYTPVPPVGISSKE